MKLSEDQFWYPSTGIYLNPARVGEKTRKCVVCGSEYVPQSRTQKYCSKCGTGKGGKHV